MGVEKQKEREVTEVKKEVPSVRWEGGRNGNISFVKSSPPRGLYFAGC